MSKIEIRTLKENLVYENDFIRVWDDDVAFPSGVQGTYVRTCWKAPYGVVVIPTDGISIVLIETQRYGEDYSSLELPKGFGTDDSSPEEDARRELLEETGLDATKIEHIATTGIGYKNHIFIARLESITQPHVRNIEKTENISSVHEIKIEDLMGFEFRNFNIHDELSIVALFMFLTRR